MIIGMILVYMTAAVVFGYVSDKNVFDRRMLLAAGVVFWSVATAMAAISQNLWELILFRGLVGVGEAAYATIAPPLITDFYPQWDRNVAFGIYYLAIPVGAALGFLLGSLLGSLFGWRMAFVALGIPGILCAIAIHRVNNPVRGINDDEKRKLDVTGDNVDGDSGVELLSAEKTKSSVSADLESHSYTQSTRRLDGLDTPESDKTLGSQSPSQIAYLELLEIVQNKHYVACVLGLTANNFALGGLADWVTVYIERYEDEDLATAGLIIGAATVIGGILGTIIGSKVADMYEGKVKSAYYLVCSLFTLPAAFFLLLAINSSTKAMTYFFIFLAEIAIWTNVAPINSMSMIVIPSHLRARASGLAIFSQHILGDVISPPLIGYISDTTGSLRTGLQITWVAVLLSGAFWMWGYYALEPLPPVQETTGCPENVSSLTYSEVLCVCTHQSQSQEGTQAKEDGNATTTTNPLIS